MSLLTRLILSLTVLWTVIGAVGCDRPKDEPGVVARVNGRSVNVGQLEFFHDLRGMGLVATENPTVDRLRRDYGRIMADLIVQELMLDELDRAGFGVSEEEVAALEAGIRADYPGDAFDRMLFEENIDPAKWREGLVFRIAQEKFVSHILKDRVRLDVTEAAEYYKEHVTDFTRPAQVTFLLFRGPDKKRVERALRDREADRRIAEDSGPDAVSVREVTIPRDNVPGPWRDILGKLRPGQAGPVGEEKGEAMALVLVGEAPAVTLDAAEAYPLVERALVEKKSNEAFAAWLAEAVSSADIRVSAHLLRADAGLDSEVPSPDILEREFPGVGDADGQTSPPLAFSEGMAKDLAEHFAGRSGDGEKAESALPDSPSAAGDSAPEPESPVSGSGETTTAEGPEGTPGPVPQPAETAHQAIPADVAPASPPGTPPPADDRERGPQTPLQPGKTADQTPQGASAASENAAAEPAPGGGAPAVSAEPAGPGRVEFLANKASWIILKVDDGQEERVYVKGGKTHGVVFKRKLAVRLGSPSDVTYRYAGREQRVESSAKEVKTLDFP
ncbi:MAG: peptidylprolyl isomerase [Thermodesulfobacteriota bacterium]